MESKGKRVHYGDGNGPVCGSHFKHDGLTFGCETWRVTCKRCKAVLNGSVIERSGPYTLSRRGGEYVMSGGRYGDHTLTVS